MKFGRPNIPHHVNSPLASTLRLPAPSTRGTAVDDVPRYGAIAQLFHWGTSLLVGLQLALGLLVANMRPGVVQYAMVMRHTSVGMAVLVLTIGRLAWRFTHAPPPLPLSLGKLERHMASGAHAVLYGLLLVQPITGWLLSPAAKHTRNLLRGISLPNFLGLHSALLEHLGSLHGLFALALAGIALLHVAAALRHHFWLKDSVLTRMLPRRSVGSGRDPSGRAGINLEPVKSG
jgi:cytochrome b561